MDTRSAKVGRIGVLLGCFLHALAPATAAEFRSGEQVSVEVDQVIDDDLYMTGDTLTIAGRVAGDVVATGRLIRIEGVVEGDLVAAGQAVEIIGEVRDDVRIAGLTLKLAGGSRVGDDLFAAGFSFESVDGSHVGGRTGLTGYQARLGGDHEEGLEASLVGLAIDGRVGGDVEARVESEAGPAWWTRFIDSPITMPSVAPGLSLDESARIEGTLTYTATRAASIAERAQISGEVTHEVPTVEPTEETGWSDRLLTGARRGVVLLLLGWGLIWLAPRTTRALTTSIVHRPAACFGWGAVTLAGVPVAVLLVVVLTTVVSMAAGLLTLYPAVVLSVVLGVVVILVSVASFWLTLAYGTPLVVGSVLGEWLLGRSSKEGTPNRYAGLLIGVALVVLLGAIPVVGVLTWLLVTFLGFGAFAVWLISGLSRSGRARADHDSTNTPG